MFVHQEHPLWCTLDTEGAFQKYLKAGSAAPRGRNHKTRSLLAQRGLGLGRAPLYVSWIPDKVTQKSSVCVMDGKERPFFSLQQRPAWRRTHLERTRLFLRSSYRPASTSLKHVGKCGVTGAPAFSATDKVRLNGLPSARTAHTPFALETRTSQVG